MIRVKKAPKPTLDQSKWLRRIAQSSMMKTYGENREIHFSLSTTGERVPHLVAAALIGNGWVRGRRDGMFDDPQSYVTLKPPGSMVEISGTAYWCGPNGITTVEWPEPNDPTNWDSRIPSSGGITEADASKREREESKR